MTFWYLLNYDLLVIFTHQNKTTYQKVVSSLKISKVGTTQKGFTVVDSVKAKLILERNA